MSEQAGPSVVSENCEAGFTLLELAVVVVVIGILFLFSYQQYLDLLVDVEKASVEQTLGTLRSAVGLKVAKMLIDGEIDQLKKYAGTNPVHLLAEVPKNYAGETANPHDYDGRSGLWHFDKTNGLLVYRVKNQKYFFSEIDGFSQARFRLSVVYDDDSSKSFAGMRLQPIEKYSWFKKRYESLLLLDREKGVTAKAETIY